MAIFGAVQTVEAAIKWGPPGVWMAIGFTAFFAGIAVMFSNNQTKLQPLLDNLPALIEQRPAAITVQAPPDAPMEPQQLPPAVQPPVSDEGEVARMRGLWEHLDGKIAAHALLTLFDEVVEAHGGKKWWGQFLHPIRENLERTARALDEALEIEAATQQSVIVDLFNDFYGAYLRAGEILYEMHHDDDLLVLYGPKASGAYVNWEPHNRVFRKQLELLTAYPRWANKLKIWWKHPTAASVFANPERYPWPSNRQPPKPRLDAPTT